MIDYSDYLNKLSRYRATVEQVNGRYEGTMRKSQKGPYVLLADVIGLEANPSPTRAAPAAQLDAELPPLPELPGAWGTMYSDALQEKDGYTADQMRGYTIDHAMQYAERIRLLDHEVITQKLAAQVLRDRVSFLESERNLMEANRRAYIDGRTAAPTPELRQAAHALIAAFDDPKCSIASVNNYVRDLERALGRTAGTAPEGYVFAPAEATEAMVHAAQDLPPPRMFGVVYRTMLAAAPSPQENTK